MEKLYEDVRQFLKGCQLHHDWCHPIAWLKVGWVVAIYVVLQGVSWVWRAIRWLRPH